jgi:predicted nucleic acid-binding protein
MYKIYGVVVWWATSVEIASAFARLARRKEIDVAGQSRAAERASNLASSWSEVKPSLNLKMNAEWLLTMHDLRAADALQLAAALEWCYDNSSRRVFLTADRRLHEAASARGFDAKLIL